MLLVFVDEMSDVKFRDYLGFCIAIVNARFYPSLKLKAQKILRRAGWNPQVEFKGSYLFSASSGCTDVEIERRIEAAHKLLDLNVAGSNSRMQFHYGRMRSNDQARDYIAHLPILLMKCLSRAPKGAGKNLLTLICDERSDVSPMRLHKTVAPAIARRGWVLLEQVFQSRSLRHCRTYVR